MRLNVAPGSLLARSWLVYTITKRAAIKSLLPSSLELSSYKLLRDDQSALSTPKLPFNVYRVDSGVWMQGMRTDVLRHTHKMHLVMLDCLSDTLRWDPVGGVQGANGRVFRPAMADSLSFSLGLKSRQKELTVHSRRGAIRPIDWTFAVEANLECYFRESERAYPMHTEITQPVRDLAPMSKIRNTFWTECRRRSRMCFATIIPCRSTWRYRLL